MTPRAKVSVTADARRLSTAFELRVGVNDAGFTDEALGARLACQRTGEIDAADAPYDAQPLDAPDEWGDLRSLHSAAASS
jgi:hypothetical protein